MQLMRHRKLFRSAAFLILAAFCWVYVGSPLAFAAAQSHASPASKRTKVGVLTPRFTLKAHGWGPMDAYWKKVGNGAHFQKPKKVVANVSLLDDCGDLSRAVKPEEAASWKRELLTGKPSPERAAMLHIWLGEWELHHTQEDSAFDNLDRAARMQGISPALQGLATFDRAIASYGLGDFDTARDAFAALMNRKTAMPGYPLGMCRGWYLQAKANARRKYCQTEAGIPNQYRFYLICSYISLVADSRGNDRPVPLGANDLRVRNSHNLLVVHRGESFKEITDAADKLGYRALTVRSDEEGLKELPKPLFAYVNHQHLVTVTHADSRGVDYVCSSCGNSTVHLSWKQWRLLDPGVCMTLTRKGGADDRLMMEATGQTPPVRVSYAGALGRLGLRSAMGSSSLATKLSQHIKWIYIDVFIYTCGFDPYYAASRALEHHLLDDDPVDLSTGQELYSGTPDLVVYNPHGPSVSWSRLYNSMRAAGEGYSNTPATYYQCADYGASWSQSYNEGVYDPTGGSTGNKYVLFPDDTRILFSATSIPTSINPSVSCSTEAGAPVAVTWNYASSGNYYTVQFRDRSKWITNPIRSGTGFHSLAQIQDINGNAIDFHYSLPTGYTLSPLLDSITDDSTGTALLTIQRAGDGSGNITAVSDAYGRTIYYHVGTYPTFNVSDGYPQAYQELDHVSLVVPTGTTAASDRYIFGYANSWNHSFNNNGPEAVPFLHQISEPSPSSPGSLSTRTINTDPNTCFVASLTDANGNVHSYQAVDASGNPITYDASQPYGGVGSNYTKVTVTDPHSNVSITYIVSFDSNGNTTGTVDGAGNATSTVTSFDSVDPYEPAGNKDANGHITHYTWDAYGNLLTLTTPRGDVYTYAYQYPTDFPLGQLTSVTHTSSTGVSQSPVTYTYYQPSDGHLNGFLKTVSAPVSGTTGSSSTVTTTYVYDTLGNLLTSTSNAANNAASSFVTTFNYTSDTAYGVTQSEALGQPLTVSDSLNHTTHYRYNATVPGSWALGGPTAVIDANGNRYDAAFNIADQPVTTFNPASGETGPGRSYVVENYQYPGGLLASAQLFDERNSSTPVYPSGYSAIRETDYSYGSMGELLSVAAVNPSTSASQVTASYTYDSNYRISTLADGNGNATSISYDAADNVSSIAYPGYTSGTADTIAYPHYDAAGNLLQRVDGRGVITNYVYNDPESALTDIRYASEPQNNVHLTYDGLGRLATYTDGAAGALDANGNTTTPGYSYSYDDLDEMTSVQTTYKGVTAGTFLPTQTVGYSYYSDGSLHTLSTPAGSFSYLYDGAGRPTGVTNPFSETASWSYQDNDLLTGQTTTAAATSYGLDALGNLTALTNTAGTSTLSSLGSFSYDGVGNELSATAAVTGLSAYTGSNSYSYDFLDRLTGETSTRSAASSSNTYGLDGANNLTTIRSGSTVPYTADNAIGTTAFSYDGNGNPTTYPSQTLSFDSEDRLTSSVSGTTTLMAAGYSGSSRVWKQTTSGARTYYLYAGGMSVCELDSSGNVTATNTGGPAGLLSRHTSSGSTFYTFDPQGNPVQRLSGTGTLIGTSLFDAYGLRASTDGSTDPYSGYHSQEGYFSDNETGFEMLGSRYYDPSTCRFVTRDPAGYGGGMNLYGYCDGNPIGESDPSGLFGWKDARNSWNNFKNTPAGRFFTSRWGSPVVSGALDDVFTFHDAGAASYTPKSSYQKSRNG